MLGKKRSCPFQHHGTRIKVKSSRDSGSEGAECRARSARSVSGFMMQEKAHGSIQNYLV